MSANDAFHNILNLFSFLVHNQSIEFYNHNQTIEFYTLICIYYQLSCIFFRINIKKIISNIERVFGPQIWKKWSRLNPCLEKLSIRVSIIPAYIFQLRPLILLTPSHSFVIFSVILPLHSA